MAKRKDELNLEEVESEETSNNEKTSDFDDFVAKAKAAAFKTRVVTITSNDKRDSNVETTVIATCENQYFGLTKILPLNVPIEVEQCLIDTIKEIKIPLHVPETINGRQTGNSVLSETNKYNISYEE